MTTIEEMKAIARSLRPDFGSVMVRCTVWCHDEDEQPEVGYVIWSDRLKKHYYGPSLAAIAADMRRLNQSHLAAFGDVVLADEGHQ